MLSGAACLRRQKFRECIERVVMRICEAATALAS